MKYIDWNIKCYCDIKNISSYLERIVSNRDCIIALQEVMPASAETLKELFDERFRILYSLDYRPADPEFDTDNRRLGVMLLISRDFEILESGVFERCLFQERTLYATVQRDRKPLRIVTLHSITGVSFKMAKAVQFRSFAECIRDYKPDILSLDANEPQKDAARISDMEFFDQGDSGKGAKAFFSEIERQDMRDVYTEEYGAQQDHFGQPLAVSHILPNGTKRRYDFIFAKKNIGVQSTAYHYEEAVEASSDHALIEADFDILPGISWK